MKKEELIKLRESLIYLRNEYLGTESTKFDSDGIILLSHTIHWLYCKIEGKPYEAERE